MDDEILRHDRTGARMDGAVGSTVPDDGDYAVYPVIPAPRVSIENDG